MQEPHPQPSSNGKACINWQEQLALHQRWLRTVVAARLGEQQAVEEVMQEVSLSAIRQQAPLTDTKKVGPWLYKVAIRQTLLYRRTMGRKRKLTERYAQQFAPQEIDHHTPDPLAWLLADERRKLVRLALAELQPRDAEVLLLKYTEGWSYRQLAERLGVSESAIESRLHRAREKLRKKLAALDVVEFSR